MPQKHDIQKPTPDLLRKLDIDYIELFTSLGEAALSLANPLEWKNAVLGGLKSFKAFSLEKLDWREIMWLLVHRALTTSIVELMDDSREAFRKAGIEGWPTA